MQRAPLFRLVVLFCSTYWSGVGPAAAQVSPPGVTSQMGASPGGHRYRSGRWGIVEIHAVNRTNETAEAETVLRFSDDPTLQFGRRVVLPPQSTLRTTSPILIPPVSESSANFVTEQTHPPRVAGGSRRSEHEAILVPQFLRLEPEPFTVGLIGDMKRVSSVDVDPPYYTGDPPGPAAPDQMIYEMLLAAKRSLNLSRRVSVFAPEELPPDRAALDGVDVLLLSSDRLASDPGGINQVRGWVFGGGTLWITLNEVGPESVAALMGDTFTTTVVDRVNLTKLNIEMAHQAQSEDGSIAFDQPVELIRVVPDRVTITHTVDGWPAAFWQPFGAGRVFFTTLGVHGWMRPTTPQDPLPEFEGDYTTFMPRQALAALAAECLLPRQPQRLAKSFEPFLTEQVGYRIIGRSAVAAILATFCAVLTVSGAWFHRIARAERILWAAPLAAVATSLVFLVIATFTKKSVPPTVATAVRAVFEPGVATGHSLGLVAMYNPAANRESLGGTRGGIFFPDMTALSGRRRLVTWTDEGAWHWEELELPAGLRMAPLEYPTVLPGSVDCRARFAPTGLQGYVGPFPFAALEDAIIVVPHQPALSVTIREDGTFSSGLEDVLAAGTFTAGALVSDRQRSRQAVLERLLAAAPRGEPLLLAWTAALDMGFVLPQSRQLGSTLLSIPVRMQKSPPGSQVAIPAPFISYRAVADSAGHRPNVYANLQHEWLETKVAATSWLRFQLPATVLPIRLERATLSMTVRAPSRSIQVLAMANGEPVVVDSLSRPIGTYQILVNRPDWLQLDESGGFRLALRVSEDEVADPYDVMAQASWKVESLRLQAAGSVQGE